MKIKNNISFGIIEKISIMLFGFATRTALLLNFGANYVGLGTLFNSVLQILNFAELGLEGVIVFKLYQLVVDRNTKQINTYVNFYKSFLLRVGIIVSLAAISLVPIIPEMISSDRPENINIYILYVFSVINSIVGYFLFGYQNALFNALGRLDIISAISLIISVIQGVSQILAISVLKNYYFFAFILPVFTIFKLLFQHVFLKIKFPQYKPEGKLDKNEKRELYIKVKGLVGYKLNALIVLSSDSVVISIFLGLITLGKYNNYFYIINALNAFIIIILNSIKPYIGYSIVTKSGKQLYDEFKAITIIYMSIITFCVCGLMTLFQDFIVVWVGESFLLDYNLVILLGIYFYVWKYLDIILLFQDVSGIWDKNRIIPYMEAIVNLVLNIVLVQFIGLYGIVLSTLASMLLVFIFISKSVFKNVFGMQKSDALFLIKIILVSFISIVGAILFNKMITEYINNLIARMAVNFLFSFVITNSFFAIFCFKKINLCSFIKGLKENSI